MIEDKGLAKDTIVIFTSDNGGLKNTAGSLEEGPLRGKKGSIYEGGHRVPLLMRYDGNCPAGEMRDALVGLNDVYSTICDFVGINVPKGSAQDSVSFAQYIGNSSKRINYAILSECLQPECFG